MTHDFSFKLVTPQELLYSSRVEEVVIPGVTGDFGVLVNHAPMVVKVRPGVLYIHQSASVVREVFIGGGFAEITGERTVILADEAVEISAIDREKATARLEKARYNLEHAKHEKDKALAEKEIAVVEAMLAVKG